MHRERLTFLLGPWFQLKAMCMRKQLSGSAMNESAVRFKVTFRNNLENGPYAEAQMDDVARARVAAGLPAGLEIHHRRVRKW